MTTPHQSPVPQTERDIDTHVAPKTMSDKIAFTFVKFLRFFADTFFAKRYGHRAVVLETVAAVPGMVGGLWQHLTALRKMRDDEGWIKVLLDEAENERMHLMTFIEIAEPNGFERAIIIIVQFFFYNAYFFLYLLAPRTAHRVVGYFEEEAVISYTQYLHEVESGRHETVRADEAEHRDVNHGFVDKIDKKRAHS